LPCARWGGRVAAMGFAAWGPSRREYEVPLPPPEEGGAEGPAGAAGRPLRRRWIGAGAWKVCSLTFGCLLALACLARPLSLDKLHIVYTEWFVRLRSVWLDESVTEVGAAEFRPPHFDAVLDVRHADEYASNAPGSCSIAAEDPEGVQKDLWPSIAKFGSWRHNSGASKCTAGSLARDCEVQCQLLVRPRSWCHLGTGIISVRGLLTGRWPGLQRREAGARRCQDLERPSGAQECEV